MFNYGTKSSGRTFTTFGPDDPVFPEAWFKWPQPHDLWGIFPRVAYDLFEMRDKTWNFSMKYFQNVVDEIIDLISPEAESKNFKIGLQKDSAGFMDVSWCITETLKSWDELRNTCMEADARKVVAPTPSSHRCTRGHSFLNLVVDKPNDGKQGLRQQGRIYICDIAYPEATDSLYYASYKKIDRADGFIEHKLVGPDKKHQKLNKKLQAQSKEINLSVSEMAQFFRNTALAIKKKKSKSGKSAKTILHVLRHPFTSITIFHILM